MSYNHYTVTNPEAHVAVVTLTPEPGAKVFQFSQAKLTELGQVFDDLESQGEIKVVVLTGVGKIFAAGGDITEMRAIVDHGNPVNGGCLFAATGQGLMDRIERSRLITIVAFNGAAVGGGCEISLACDYRIATTTTKLGQPEINLGLIPGWGGTRRLERLVGLGRAKYMIYTGEIITAQTAAEWGLIQEVVEPEELLNKALEVARKMTVKSGQVLAWCKESIHAGLWLEDAPAQEVERKLFGACFGTEDTKEGLSAFLEKRAPEFKS